MWWFGFFYDSIYLPHTFMRERLIYIGCASVRHPDRALQTDRSTLLTEQVWSECQDEGDINQKGKA